MNVGEYIKQLRINSGMTMEELGQKVGVKKSAVHKWESGMVTNLKRETIKKLADVFNVPASSFITVDMPQKDDKPSPISDSELKFALFNGQDGITDEMLEEVRQFAEFVKNKK